MITPDAIKTEVRTIGDCPVRTVVASLRIEYVRPLHYCFREVPAREIEFIKHDCARLVWRALFDGLDREICELYEFVFLNAGPLLNWQELDARVTKIRNQIRYQCPQENPKPETPALCSTMTTEQVKAINRASQTVIDIETTLTSSTGESLPGLDLAKLGTDLTARQTIDGFGRVIG